MNMKYSSTYFTGFIYF